MQRQPSNTPALLARARYIADVAANAAVTKYMEALMHADGLPFKGISWSLEQRPGGGDYLIGHVEAATPDDKVRAIVDEYAEAFHSPDAGVGERPHGDPSSGLREYEASGLVIAGAPASVIWGVLGYGLGESSE
ncbi:hypothetical protein AB0I28_12265 [Phytomonospora sp. NPDC050363]|uniref:hypothetical protein n=1 Tax=Phytomonospora sp. NPDC050363 TaxID=3155642 RepID=UPI0033E6EECC